MLSSQDVGNDKEQHIAAETKGLPASSSSVAPARLVYWDNATLTIVRVSADGTEEKAKEVRHGGTGFLIATFEDGDIVTEEPNLSDDMFAGLYAPTSGVINPYEACFSLIESARVNGLELSVDNPVLGIVNQGDSLAVQTPDSFIMPMMPA